MGERDGTVGLSHTDCWTGLDRMSFGRVVFTEGGMPEVRPVRFVPDPEPRVLRVTTSTGLAAVLHGQVVAFQADDLGPVGRSLSVVAIGRARRDRSEGHAAEVIIEVERLRGTLRDPHGTGRAA